MSNNVSITVLRASDSKKGEVSLPLSSSLDALKDSIVANPELSSSSSGTTATVTLKKRHLRIFHLGRELKSSGRSLSALGIGKFHNYLVHVTCKPVSGDAGGTRKKGGGASPGSGKKNRKRAATGETVELDLSSSDEDDYGEKEEADEEEDEDEVIELDGSQDSSRSSRRKVAAAAASVSAGGGGGGGGEVIDLLDSDDDDDEVAAVGSKRQRVGA